MENGMIISMDMFDLAKEYWLNKLVGDLKEVNLVSDFPGTKHYRPADYNISLGKRLTPGLIRMSKNNDLSLYVLLLTSFKILLYKYTGQDDITVASPVYNVNAQDYNKWIALRDVVYPGMTFKELLMDVKQTVVEGYKNQFYPIKKIMELTGMGNNLSLSRVIFFFESIHDKELVDDIIEHFGNNITFSVSKGEEDLVGHILYNAGLYTAASIKRLGECYLFILEQVLGNTGIRVAHLELLKEAEKKKILAEFNETGNEYPAVQRIHQLFAAQAGKKPDAVALRSPIDLKDIYEGLISLQESPDFPAKIAKCCFRMNPYIFQRDVQFSDETNGFKILKTHQHNSVVVNTNMFNLITLMNGKRNVGMIFSHLEAKRLSLVLYSVNADDVMEIGSKFNKKEEILFNGNFGDLVRILQSLYRENLIELADYDPVISTTGDISPGVFDENESFTETGRLETLLGRDREPCKADVLILGDTPGLSTTGLLYLASYLVRNGVKSYCQFSDTNWDRNSLKQHIETLLELVRPSVVAVSMKWFLHMARVLEACKIVKTRSPAVKVVVGGNTASYYWQEVIRYDYIDYIVCGDGELPLLKICKGEENIPNCIYKKNGQVRVNPITYLHDETNSPDIYLSHLDEIMLSTYAPIFGIFFIYTQRGCLMNCIYCGGCNQAMQKTFNRRNLFLRSPREVRKDIIEAKKYSSTMKFLFDDYSNEDLLQYCKQLWEGIDLSSHFCFITNVIPPSSELTAYVNKTFKYVYWNIDICSLSERHRNQLFSMGLVKRQPPDKEILAFLDQCEKYPNAELIINLITGLPYVTTEDLRESERMLNHIMNKYSCFSELFWARLHAQPGAPISENAGEYDMYSLAADFETFLHISRENFDGNSVYPGVDAYNYPYIYFNDSQLNSDISRHYAAVNSRIRQNKERKRKALVRYRELSYRELNNEANKVAGVLKMRGVTPGAIVGILVERSPDMIIGLMGILKAGAAYLPLDPEYPPERIKYMLEDCGIACLLSRDHLKDKIKGKIECIDMGQINEYRPEKTVIENRDPMADTAYIIYTSGSTGKPKGVLIEHRSIVNTLLWRKEYYHFDQSDSILQIPSFAFDSSVEDIFTPLISGSRIVLIQQQNRFNIRHLEQLINENHITHFLITPGLYNSFLEEIPGSLKHLKSITVAGESFTDELINKHFDKLDSVLLVNEYGPTENSVCTTVHTFSRRERRVLIGKPIHNVSCYILDVDGNLCPGGVAGELYISGNGLARGYLNGPELSDAKFVTHRSIPGRKMYKTGDRARWSSGGSIEFLGRIDNQVKIRGFRVELGEIENCLLRHEAVKDTVVTVRTDETGNKQVCAYIVLNKVIELPGLGDYLSINLPDYMVPTYFVEMEKIPLTANGKTDIKALPSPAKGEKEKYTAPGNVVEKKLVEIWESVLARKPIGVNHNFFTSGGDSIKAIQIVSRLTKAGYRLEMRDIFNSPTIAQLAPLVREQIRIIDQSGVPGTVPLTPIQEKFFADARIDPHHYNQSVMLHTRERLEESTVKNIFSKIQEHHDALRMTFRKDKNNLEVIQTNEDLKYPISQEVYNYRNQGNIKERLEMKANEIQASIDLENGPLMKLGLFHLEDGVRLLIVIHHLVIDAVSWRILFEDLETLYQQYKKGEPLSLPLKTDSYKNWSEKLRDYADNPSFLREKEYWKNLESQDIPMIRPDYPSGTNRLRDSETLSIRLDKEETHLLLNNANKAFGTKTDDLLLTAFGMAAKDTFGLNRLLIALEGHGREEILDGINISRTVGWFTSLYPVLLDILAVGDLARQIKEIKEGLRHIPNNGIGYGILRYLTSQEFKKDIDFKLKPQVCFNYLGQFDSDIKQMSSFEIAEESSGNNRDSKEEREYLLVVTGLIVENRLEISIEYNKRQYKLETIKKLIDGCQSNLSHIIGFCLDRENTELTPSDLDYNEFTIDELENLFE
jgi:amino acid adenylation domain-containing protein/non-ribosomal peptide synthase protein (TIGR01720 family)